MTNSVQNSLFTLGYNKDTAIAAIVASTAATSTATVGIAPWIMFVGWVAFFTNPTSLASALKGACCVSMGIVLGAIASSCIGLLSAQIGGAALALVVFVVAMLVVSLRAVPMVNNIAAWFLGLITFFALHGESNLSVILPLILTVNFGALAGYTAFKLQQSTRR